MERIFGRPIVTQEQMRTRIRELGRQIGSDYAGKDLVLVGVLKGPMPFMPTWHGRSEFRCGWSLSW